MSVSLWFDWWWNVCVCVHRKTKAALNHAYFQLHLHADVRWDLLYYWHKRTNSHFYVNVVDFVSFFVILFTLHQMVKCSQNKRCIWIRFEVELRKKMNKNENSFEQWMQHSGYQLWVHWGILCHFVVRLFDCKQRKLSKIASKSID